MCALFSVWVVLRPNPRSITFACMIYLYTIAASVMGVVGPMILNGGSKNIALLTWVGYSVIVASCLLAVLQVICFVVSIAVYYWKCNFDKFINKRKEVLPLPSNASSQPVNPNFNYNSIMAAPGVGGVSPMAPIPPFSNRVDPNYFNAQPRL